ncbi:MAG: 5-formyltetrahydrofolate cyclo-ligase [Candidatus Methylarchaceae archaeon HK01M]|nr:5-formyltetrahydrofolate cyclo-ligase [Candidatus Methylarchaceae archaeon HK01M]
MIRKEIWRLMEESGISRFPRPIIGRIPNFEGSERAALRLINQPEFQSARVVKVNPDSPQSYVRRGALLSGKLLVMPSPRLRNGFILLDPKTILKSFFKKASTIKGAFKYGRFCSIEDLPNVDLIVAGSVAISRDGLRVGKGGGYSEIEYGILRELSLIGEATPIFSTVHDVQIIDEAPKEEHDFMVDVIITPSKVLRVERKYSQPRGIFWEKLTKHQLEDMHILLELRKILNSNR